MIAAASFLLAKFCQKTKLKNLNLQKPEKEVKICQIFIFGLQCVAIDIKC
jgi:hypothetical protein